jgi:hypothetical protein
MNPADYYGNANPTLLQMVDPLASRICEFGCGAGALARAIKSRSSQPVHYVGLEIEADQLAKAPMGFQAQTIDSDNPLIGPDIVLASEVARLTVEESRNNHKPAHFLAMMGYERYQGGSRFSINGTRSAIWIHRDRFDEGLERPE